MITRRGKTRGEGRIHGWLTDTALLKRGRNELGTEVEDISLYVVGRSNRVIESEA
jgi:hypothetical protein